MRLYILFLLCFTVPVWAVAQTDDLPLPNDPAVAYFRQQLNEKVAGQMKSIDWGHTARKTAGAPVLYTIPVVVHVVHDYGEELIADDVIYNIIDAVNRLLLMRSPDTVNIIDKYKSVAASTQIALKLAAVDPLGKPTKGIEHSRSYLTMTNQYNTDQLKMNQWPQDRYLNIWIVNSCGRNNFGGYCYTPFLAAYIPGYDGVVINEYLFSPFSLARLAANYLNLQHPCGYLPPCSDYDGIPDTPPCWYDFSLCKNVFDTTCDTPNTQNIMDNIDSCGFMFTYGQAKYMQYILQIDIGKRDSLVTPFNFTRTGMGLPVPDMLPVPDFYAKNIINNPTRFFAQDQEVRFTHKCWNDTITGVAWTFSNNAAIPSSTSLAPIANKFGQLGWVTVTLTAAGNNSGTAGITDTQAVYIADTTPVSASGYFQEFNTTGGDLGKWPVFNYYNNGFKWELYNTGFYDNTCISYTGYDARPYPENLTGSPEGDYDDLFTPVFDLTGFPGPCYLNFMSAGANSSSRRNAVHDSLEIDYSTDRSVTWKLLKSIKGNALANNGTLSIPYAPLWMGDWVPQAIPLPAAARTRQTIFRFRYHPGADSFGVSTGNNFYMDRINFGAWPQSVADALPDGVTVMLYPNPSQHGSCVMIKENTSVNQVTVIVTDMAGRVVCKLQQQINGRSGGIDIPESLIAAKGMYLVHIITGQLNETQKLVVY